MDYLDCFDRQELIKERARCSSELNQLIIKKEDESVKENVEKVKNDLTAIMLKCDERLKAQKEEKQLGTDADQEQSLALHRRCRTGSETGSERRRWYQ